MTYMAVQNVQPSCPQGDPHVSLESHGLVTLYFIELLTYSAPQILKENNILKGPKLR